MKTFLLRLLVAALLALGCTWAFAQPAGFVRRQGVGFVLDGRPYRSIGANYWYGGLLATQGVGGDPGGEEQGPNSVFDADQSTWAVIIKYLNTIQ